MKLGHSTAVGPIGLDLGEEAAHLLQLEPAGSELQIRAAASVPYSESPASLLAEPSALKRLIKNSLRAGPFQGRRVVTAIPRERVKLMVLNYQLGGSQDEPELILSLVEERVSQPLDECVIDYVRLREDPEKREDSSALVAVSREQDVIDYLELLRAAGLTVEALEIGPVAIRRLLTSLAQDQIRENVMAVQFGCEKSYLIVLWGRRLLLYREVDFGVDRAIEQLASALEMDAEGAAALLDEYGVFPDPSRTLAGSELASADQICRTIMEIVKSSFGAVADQVASALVYTASRTRGESVDQVYLLGSITRWPGADRLFGSLLSMPVEVLDPAASMRFGPSGLAEPHGSGAPELALAAGLALRGMTSGE
jgi:type IV pilus assembly protein PilM